MAFFGINVILEVKIAELKFLNKKNYFKSRKQRNPLRKSLELQLPPPLGVRLARHLSALNDYGDALELTYSRAHWLTSSEESRWEVI